MSQIGWTEVASHLKNSCPSIKNLLAGAGLVGIGIAWFLPGALAERNELKALNTELAKFQDWITRQQKEIVQLQSDIKAAENQIKALQGLD